jgi:hypothetical protein
MFILIILYNFVYYISKKMSFNDILDISTFNDDEILLYMVGFFLSTCIIFIDDYFTIKNINSELEEKPEEIIDEKDSDEKTIEEIKSREKLNKMINLVINPHKCLDEDEITKIDEYIDTQSPNNIYNEHTKILNKMIFLSTFKLPKSYYFTNEICALQVKILHKAFIGHYENISFDSHYDIKKYYYYYDYIEKTIEYNLLNINCWIVFQMFSDAILLDIVKKIINIVNTSKHADYLDKLTFIKKRFKSLYESKTSKFDYCNLDSDILIHYNDVRRKNFKINDYFEICDMVIEKYMTYKLKDTATLKFVESLSQNHQNIISMNFCENLVCKKLMVLIRNELKNIDSKKRNLFINSLIKHNNIQYNDLNSLCWSESKINEMELDEWLIIDKMISCYIHIRKCENSCIDNELNEASIILVRWMLDNCDKFHENLRYYIAQKACEVIEYCNYNKCYCKFSREDLHRLNINVKYLLYIKNEIENVISSKYSKKHLQPFLKKLNNEKLCYKKLCYKCNQINKIINNIKYSQNLILYE